MPPRPRPYKHTVVWLWAQSLHQRPDRVGTVIGTLKKRVDMVHRFPHKRFMYNYLLKAHVTEAVAEAVIEELWASYYEFNHRISHGITPEVVAPSWWDNSRGAWKDPPRPLLEPDASWIDQYSVWYRWFDKHRSTDGVGTVRVVIPHKPDNGGTSYNPWDDCDND